MKREDIAKMRAALGQVGQTAEVKTLNEKKMDPVDKKDVKGKFTDRDDKDIDNDGDADKSDKFLHARRKKVTKAISSAKGKKGETELEIQTQESLSPLDRYKLKTEEAMPKVKDPAASEKPKDVKQGKEVSATKDGGKLNKVETPKEFDAHAAVDANRAVEKKAATKAASTQTDDVKESVLTEDYHTNQMRYLNNMTAVANEIATIAENLHSAHMKAMEAQKRISAAYSNGKKPSDADRKLSNGKMYDCKYVVRQLEDARDSLEQKVRTESVNSDEEVDSPVQSESTKFGRVVNPETATPISMRDALAMMEDRAKQTKGAAALQPYDDNWSGSAKKFAGKHKVDTPDESDINKAVNKNTAEVGKSLTRAVNYRHNDQQIGDKKAVGNDGK